MSAHPPIIAVLTDRYKQYQADLVENIATELAAAGYGTVCIAAKELQANNGEVSPHAVCNSIYDQVNKYGAHGLIALSGTLGHGVDTETITRFLQSFSMPKVSLGLNLANVASVYFEESKGMSELMHHLLDGETRNKFAFVRGHHNDPYSLGREEIFRTTLLQHGRSDEDNYYLEGDYNPFTTFQAVSELLASDNQVDCIVAANDVMAASAARAAKLHGLRIPEDITISGFDDSSDATRHSPAITTVRQPLKKMAVESVALLLDQIRFTENAAIAANTNTVDSSATNSIIIDSELIVRRSTNASDSETACSDMMDESELRHCLENAMYGLVTPEQLSMRQISEPLWNTLRHGSVDIISTAAELSDTIVLQHAHWWINLCDQIDLISERLLESQYNVAHIALVSSAVSKVKERIWAQEMDQHFETTRLQNVRFNLQLAMSSSNDIDGILAAMDGWLFEMNPNRCFLVRYIKVGAKPDSKAQVIHVFRDGKSVPPESAMFDTVQILPPELADDLGIGLLVFAPVYANDNLFGYLLIDPTNVQLDYIDAAAECIGNAMRTHYYIRKLQIQKGTLESVNAELATLANFDALTGLANRLQFQQYLENCTQEFKEGDRPFALLFIDLDGFKLINDTLGHGMGDLLLNMVAERLLDSVEYSSEFEGFISRLGGDEFTVILHPQTDQSNISSFCQTLLEQLATPYMLKENEVAISGSIGCALYPDNADDADTLVVHADIAMYRAKEGGKNSITFFCSSMNTADTQELELAQELRHALANNELSMHFQPRIDLRTGRMCAAEALMRWFVNTSDGLVIRAYPDVFITLAEKIGVISQLDTYALHYGCKQAAQWANQGTPLQISVNVSVNQLQQEDFVETVLCAIEQHQLDPSLLELEITESAAMTDVESNIAKLSQIKAAGIEVSIDDFGTGYSSFNYLKRLPVNNLKIDRSFIMDITESDGGNSADAAIVRSVVALGKSMDFGLIAEGIETKEQHEFVHSLDCDQAQGYLYAKPLTAAEITALLHDDAQRQRTNFSAIKPLNSKAA